MNNRKPTRPGVPDAPILDVAGRQRMIQTIHRYAKELGLEATLTDPADPKPEESVADEPQYDPIALGHRFVFTGEQYAALQERFGDAADVVIQDRFDTLLATLTGEVEDEPAPVVVAEPVTPPTKPGRVVIPVAFMQRDILGALPKHSELAFRVLGELDNEGNLYVSDVKYARR